jgi:hypothetical protein
MKSITTLWHKLFVGETLKTRRNYIPQVGVRQALMEAIRGIGFSFFIGGVR